MKRGFRSSAFSVFETTFVLVMIALMLMGMLYFRDILKFTSIRQIVSQVEQYDSAVLYFRGKYDAIPGDFARADQYFGLNVDGESTNGNDDGVINSDNYDVKKDQEMSNFFFHLAKSNLINETKLSGSHKVADIADRGVIDPAFPKLKGGQTGLAIYNEKSKEYINGHYWDVNIIRNESRDSIVKYDNKYTPQQGHLLDVKMDDGKPNQGRVVASGPVKERPLKNQVACLKGDEKDITTWGYAMTSKKKACSVYIKTTF